MRVQTEDKFSRRKSKKILFLTYLCFIARKFVPTLPGFTPLSMSAFSHSPLLTSGFAQPFNIVILKDSVLLISIHRKLFSAIFIPMALSVILI